MKKEDLLKLGLEEEIAAKIATVSQEELKSYVNKKEFDDLTLETKTKDDKHAAEIKQLKVGFAVDSALTTAKAKNLKAAKALLELDISKLELDKNGLVNGLDEKIKALQVANDSKFLFDTEVKLPSIRGAVPGESSREDIDQNIDTSKMSYEELAAYMSENVDAKI